jgi:hypothetical protein
MNRDEYRFFKYLVVGREESHDIPQIRTADGL